MSQLKTSPCSRAIPNQVVERTSVVLEVAVLVGLREALPAGGLAMVGPWRTAEVREGRREGV